MAEQDLLKENLQMEAHYKDSVEEIAKIMVMNEEALRKLDEKDPFMAALEAWRKKEAVQEAYNTQLKDAQYDPVTGESIWKGLENSRKWIESEPFLPEEVARLLTIATKAQQALRITAESGTVANAFSSYSMQCMKRIRYDMIGAMEQKTKYLGAESVLKLDREKMEIELRNLQNLKKELLNARDLFVHMIDFLNNVEMEDRVKERAKELLTKGEVKLVSPGPDLVPGAGAPDAGKPEKKSRLFTEDDLQKGNP